MISVTWTIAVDDFLTTQRAAGRPETTCQTRRWHLCLAARTLGDDPWSVDESDLLSWFAERDWATETRRSVRSTLRAFYAWGVRAGRIETSPAGILPSVRAAAPAPRPVPTPMYRLALMHAPENVRLMIRLAGEAGLRRAEVAAVHSRDLVEDLVGWSLIVHGKGGKTRVVPLASDLGRVLRALGPGFAFPGDDHGHLSPRWVGTLVSRCLPDGWTMHKLRHRFATLAYAVDRDVFTVQDLLGHASPATTRAYVAIPDDAKRRTVEAVAA